MHYYEVRISGQGFHGSGPLTYKSDQTIETGTVVVCPLGRNKAVGFVVRNVPKPTFAAKDIQTVFVGEVIPEQLRKLRDWIAAYYPGPDGLINQLVAPSMLQTVSRKSRPAVRTESAVQLPTLTPEQQTAASQIATNQYGAYLLHGDTGSGKTRLYASIIDEVIKGGKSAIVLTPEIGLTPQLQSYLETAFPGMVVAIHSTQSPAERRNNWRFINSTTDPLIVIGPRSALFAPLKNLGLIVVDEFHDTAYKQDQSPYYQATRVAAQLAKLHGCPVIYGSATPPLHDYYAFTEKQLPILRLTESAVASDHTVSTVVVDLTDRSHFSRSPWLSNELIDSIGRALLDGYQALVFLNRRGTSRLVVCQSCGWQATCPRCDLPLTYHGDIHKLRCHTCGYVASTPSSCPDCQGIDLQFKTIGTKALFAEVQRLFPEARLRRFDSDLTKADQLQEAYQQISAGEVDIIIGTQMLAKGLDLPKLAVVGVVAADTSLHFPDYTAEERTYQLLNQVAGRVGRGHVTGTVVIQTYHPTSETITAALAKNYGSFYAKELASRQLYKFPPFFFVLKISVDRATRSSAQKTANDIAQHISASGLAVQIVGPAPAFSERLGGKYRWQIIVKATRRDNLLKVIKLLPKNCVFDIDPSNLL